MMEIVQQTFPRSINHYDQCPSGFRSAVLGLREYVVADGSREFLKANHNFQEDARDKWNPNANNITRSLFMGFVGIDEGNKKGAGTVMLDLLLKVGTIGVQRQMDCPRRLRRG